MDQGSSSTSLSTSTSYTFTVTEAATYTANLTGKSYTITASSNNTNYGTVSGGGSKTYNTSCTLTATPKTGYHFVNWTESGTQVSTSASYTFTVTGARTLVANFAINTYSVSVSSNNTNYGTVSGGGTFNHGASCTVTATSNTGYHFVNWTEGGTQVSTSASYQFTVTSARTLVANFSNDGYNITVEASPTGAGTVGGGGTYNYGQSVTITASPSAGYNFARWTKNGTQVSTNATYNFTATESATYVAVFTPISYNISVSANPVAGGSVSGGGSIAYNTQCEVVAEHSNGYSFVNWTEGGTQVSTSARYSFTVTGARTLVANFSQNSYTVTVGTQGGGTGSTAKIAEPQQSYHYGDSITLIATADNGYTFDHWTKNGTTIQGGTTLNTTVTENSAYVAVFTQNQYIIATNSDPTGAGSIEGGGMGLHYGDNVELTATANTGYMFKYWRENTTAISTDNPYRFTVTGSRTLAAVFVLECDVDVVSSPSNGGYVRIDEGTAGTSAHKTVGQGDNVSVSESTNTGYVFAGWHEGTPSQNSEET